MSDDRYHGERERGVDEALRELDVTTRKRKIGNHFAKRDLSSAETNARISQGEFGDGRVGERTMTE